MQAPLAIATLAAALLWSPQLMAQPSARVETSRTSRVWHAPTAWLQPHGGAIATAGATHRGAPFTAVTVGLGGVAELGVDLGPSLADCRRCGDGVRGPESVMVARALFRVGVAESTWFTAQPAVVLGFRGPLRGASFEADGLASIRAAQLYLVASKSTRSVRVHAGAAAWDVAATDDGSPVVLDRARLAGRVRPLAGLSWTPTIYPRTSVLADVTWQPVFREDRAALGWMAAWGIRYEALSWASVELGVRHRQGEDLADSTVLVRVNARRW